MPTPESALFLASKPKVPPTFQGVDFNNNQAVVDARDAIIREQWVKQMMARLVREELGEFLPSPLFSFPPRATHVDDDTLSGSTPCWVCFEKVGMP